MRSRTIVEAIWKRRNILVESSPSVVVWRLASWDDRGRSPVVAGVRQS